MLSQKRSKAKLGALEGNKTKRSKRGRGGGGRSRVIRISQWERKKARDLASVGANKKYQRDKKQGE